MRPQQLALPSRQTFLHHSCRRIKPQSGFRVAHLSTTVVLGQFGASSYKAAPKGLLTLPSESVSHNWLYFVVVVAVDKWEAAFCFPLIHSLFSSVARRQLAIAAVLRFQSCSNCVGLT